MSRKLTYRWFPALAVKRVIRNDEIVAKRMQGYTLRRLGREYGISFERVRQIIYMAKMRAVDLPLKLQRNSSRKVKTKATLSCPACHPLASRANLASCDRWHTASGFVRDTRNR